MRVYIRFKVERYRKGIFKFFKYYKITRVSGTLLRRGNIHIVINQSDDQKGYNMRYELSVMDDPQNDIRNLNLLLDFMMEYTLKGINGYDVFKKSTHNYDIIMNENTEKRIDELEAYIHHYFDDSCINIGNVIKMKNREIKNREKTLKKAKNIEKREKNKKTILL